MTAAHVSLASRRATRHLAAALAPHLRVGDVIWLEGSLGAGKTFFTRGLLRALGVPEAVPVTSPTFALVHEHDARVPVRHLDLYRLGEGDPLTELGIDEARSEALLVVEWGARFRAGLGGGGLEIRIALGERGAPRSARLEAFDARGETLLEATLADRRVVAVAPRPLSL